MTPSLSIILVRPQLGDNIGPTARAMGNFGVSDLRLVSPRDPWPNPMAESASVGARSIIKNAKVFSTLQEAIGDLSFVFCTTARSREIKKEFYTLSEGVSFVKTLPLKKIGLVFGPEQAGLNNQDMSFCHGALSIPTHPSLPSLNLSHAALLCLYAFCAGEEAPHPQTKIRASSQKTTEKNLSSLASQDRVISFLLFLEVRLVEKTFFYPIEKADKMKQNLRDIFLRRPLSKHDVNTLFGVVRSLGKNVDK